MTAKSYIPTDRLKPFIKTFLIVESEHEVENRLLPDTSIVMAFRIRGNVTDKEANNSYNLPSSAITGLRKSPRLICYSDKAATLLVIFKAGGASAFFREPLNELFGKSLPLDDIIRHDQLQRIEEQLSEADDNQQRVNLVEQFLISRLDEQRADLLIDHAIQKIKLAKGDIRIKTLAGSMAISLDPFEKRFRRVAGISAKQFADITRFRNLIDQYSASESLTNIALDSGYFDQAHFIKDFRSFTGQAPQQFFKSSAWW